MVENNNPDIKTIIKASYKPQRDAEADLVKLGYKYDPELSTMENKVFYDPKTGKPNIAYRGSVRVKDWIGNLKLGLGFKSEMQKEESNWLTKLNRNTDKHQILLVILEEDTLAKKREKDMEDELILIIRQHYQRIYLNLPDQNKQI